jgi:hypothetical protein
MPINLTRRRKEKIILGLIILYLVPTAWVGIIAFNIHFPYVNPPPSESSYALLIPLLMTPGRTIQDLSLGINITYTTAVVVNQAIKFNATAELNSPTALGITALYVFFQDALYYPPSAFYFNLPFPGQLLLTNDTKLLYTLTGNATVYWNHPGTYSPRIIAALKNGGQYDFGLISYESIQVLPEQTLTEIQTNRVNLVLTYAIFILTALGLAGTIIDVWITEPSESQTTRSTRKPK